VIFLRLRRFCLMTKIPKTRLTTPLIKLLIMQ